ncbi:MAG: hypothetical protein ABMA13_18390 [Chthoniobacteraceae bacterium]
MPTTPTQRGVAFKYVAAPSGIAAFIIDASTFQEVFTEFQNRQTILDHNLEDVCEIGQNPAKMLEFEATIISGQTAPKHLDLVTVTIDGSATEFVVIDPVPITGFGMVQRVKLKLKKADSADYSP